MKNKIQFLFFILLFQNFATAAPGDTTWVTVFENRKIDHYGNFDTIANLPTATVDYRKIRLHYILGRYACAPGEQYCGSWDYTTMVIAQPANADTVELARIITPYATDWLQTNRSHDYVVEVTDYSSILKGVLPMRYKYEGYSWGFTLTLKIEYIEGTPPMKAIEVRNVYDGYFSYGNSNDPIENKLVAKTFSNSSSTSKTYLKNTISGHGSDDTQCSEFCSKFYQLFLNGNQIDQVQLWKSDCGYNNISPQTGTWLYDRANWCPGEQVYPILHPLNVGATPFTVNMDMESYTAPNQSNATGGFNIVSQLITYETPAFSIDASLEDIIAPTNDPNYARSNSTCSNIIVKLKNNGTTPLNTVKFRYRLKNGPYFTYTWNGNLEFLGSELVDFGSNFDLFLGDQSDIFEVEILEVNGTVGDEDSFNNQYQSKFKAVNMYPNQFIVYFKSNKASSPSNSSINDASWTIYDAAGTIVASRLNAEKDFIYRDTVSLPNGCYTFEMNDENCDGISWWAYQYYNPNPGSGIIRFNKMGGGFVKTFTGDFGCQFKERFTVGHQLSNDELENDSPNLNLFPNPAKNELNISYLGENNFFDIITIYDISGKKIQENKPENQTTTDYLISLDKLKSGSYIVSVAFSSGHTVTDRFIKE